MNIKVSTNISSEFKETSIIINATELSKEVEDIIKYLSNISIVPNQIIGNKNNKIYFIDLDRITCFFSKDKYNYMRTKKDIYRVKYKMYELEEMLEQKGFVRISNSCIININQVECFDISILGTVLVKLKDNTQESVSKRNITQVKQLLNERGK